MKCDACDIDLVDDSCPKCGITHINAELYQDALDDSPPPKVVQPRDEDLANFRKVKGVPCYYNVNSRHNFDISVPYHGKRDGKILKWFKSFQCYRHKLSNGYHTWGLSLLQINHRHFFYFSNSPRPSNIMFVRPWLVLSVLAVFAVYYFDAVPGEARTWIREMSAQVLDLKRSYF